MFKRDRFRCNVGRNGQTIFRLSTVYEPIAQSIDRIPHLYIHAIRPDRFDYAREFVTLNNRKRSQSAFRSMECGVPVQLRGRDRCGINPNEHLIVLRYRFRRIFIEKRFGAAHLMSPYRFHGKSLIAWPYFSLESYMASFRLRTLKISRPSRTRATCLAGYSATTLLPEQDKPAPSGPMSGVSWFAVSCGVRLSEVGVETFPKPRVAGSIPLAISVPLCSSPCHPLRNSQSGYDCARIPWHTPHPLPCHNDPLEGEKSFFHFP